MNSNSWTQNVECVSDFSHFRSAQSFHLNMVSDSLGVAANQVDENNNENNDEIMIEIII